MQKWMRSVIRTITFAFLLAAPPFVMATASIDESLFNIVDTEPVLSKDQMLYSQLCTESQFNTDLYKFWCSELKSEPKYHRKQWEFVYILQALDERGLLKAGMRGVGFGVGRETLPAVFAKYGVEVLATDLDPDNAESAGWVDGQQHLSLVKNMNAAHITSDEKMERLVKIRYIDMRNIPDDVKNYDFTWSSCSLEHLGSIELGLEFIENSLKTLKPGGIAVHTTEYNLSSDTNTLQRGNTVIFRKRDIQSLVKRLTSAGHEVYVNYNFGSGKLDKYIDLPPYSKDEHLKLAINKYVSTSIGLIIRKKMH